MDLAYPIHNALSPHLGPFITKLIIIVPLYAHKCLTNESPSFISGPKLITVSNQVVVQLP